METNRFPYRANQSPLGYLQICAVGNVHSLETRLGGTNTTLFQQRWVMGDIGAFVIDARTAAAITKYSRHCHIRCAAATPPSASAPHRIP